MVVTPKELYLDASFGNSQAHAKYVYVHQPKDDVRPFRVDTADCAPWIRAQVLEQVSEEGPGRIAVNLMDETIVEQQTDTRFRVFTDGSEEPVDVAVHVFKRKPYRLSTRMLIVGGSATKRKFTISLEPSRTPDSVRIATVVPSCSEIIASHCMLADDTPSLQVTVSERLGKGLHKIDLSLASDNGDEFSEIIHVLRTH